MSPWETLTMSRKEGPRAGLLKAAMAGQISNAQVAVALRLSVRHVQRLKVRYRADGAAGLRHRLRGRPSARGLPATLRRRARELLQTTYRDVNDCHAAEKLREVEGLPISRASVQRLRRALGLPAKHRRRPREYRARRTPEARMGALVQLDASPFAGLGGRGGAMTLHGAIDAATATVLALVFRPTEDLHGYATLLHQLGTGYGLPLALYGDRLNVFVRNDRHWTLEEELQGAQHPHPLWPDAPGFGHRLHRRRLPPGEGSHRTPLAHPAGSPHRGAAAARPPHPRRRQRVPASLPHRFQPPLHPCPRERYRGLAPRAARPGRPAQLPLPSRRRPRQHRPPPTADDPIAPPPPRTPP